MRKKFDYALFRANDALARKIGKLYWESIGHIADDNPDKYGPDLIVEEVNIDTHRYNKSPTFFCEVEIKRAWKGKDFTYKSIQIPHRKAKYLDTIKYGKECNFLILNNEQTHAFYILHNDLKTSPVAEVPNKYVPSGEMFFQVPLTKARLVELPNEK